MKKWFYNLKISARMIFGYAIVIIITAIVGAMGIFSVQKVNTAYTTMYQNNMMALEYLEKGAVAFQRSRSCIATIALNGVNHNEEKIKYFLERLDFHNGNIDESLTNYSQTSLSPDEKVEFDNLNSHIKEFRDQLEKAKQLVANKRAVDAQTLIENQMRDVATVVDASFTQLFELNVEMGKEYVHNSSQTATIFTILLCAFVLIGIGAALRIGFLISRSISNPVNKMMVAANKLAVGDINVDVQSDSTDEIGLLMHSFEK
ncbi:MCP four helix bundle domain-containing protein, partial [Oscillospiraceae bacterium PP1C4]